MSLGGVVCYYGPGLEWAVGVYFSQELEFSQSYICLILSLLQSFKQAFCFYILHYSRYFTIKNLRKRHTKKETT